MANEDMKRCFTPYVIRDMQVKTTMRYHYTPIRMPKTRTLDAACGATGTLIRGFWEYKMVQPLWKTAWQSLTKLNILLPYEPVIMLLGIYSKELKPCVHTKTCR